MQTMLNIAVLALLASATVPAWTVPVDSRTTAQWMAESPGRVYVIRDGSPAALDTTNGAVLWRAADVHASGAPAYLRGAVAVPQGGRLLVLDASNGRVRATRILGGEVAVAAAPGALVAISYGSHAANFLAGFDPAGRMLWKRAIARTGNAILTALGGNAVAIEDYDTRDDVIFDATDGKAVAQATSVNSIIGNDGRYVWFSVVDGGIKGLDLDTNRSIALHGHVLAKGASVEHAVAVAVIDGRLHVIDLRTQSDARLRVDGRWIGGPVAGKILVERGDGLYVQPLSSSEKAVRVARYTSESRIVASDNFIAYVGLLNGTVLAIDMRAGRLVQRTQTPCRFYEGFTASAGTAIVHCDAGDNRSQLVAFPRALLTARR